MSSLRTVSGNIELYDPTSATPYLRTPADGTDGFTEVLNGKLQVDSLHLHSTSIDNDINIPSGFGTVVAESLSGSGSISGSGSLSILEDTQTAVRTPMEQPLDLGGYDIEDTNGNIIWDAASHELQNVGGTTDANSGAIRMANSSAIKSRNSGDSADIELISGTTNDAVAVGVSHTVKIAGGFSMRASGGNSKLTFYNSLRIENLNGNTVLSGDDNGNVEIPNGDLKLSDNTIRDVNRVFGPTASNLTLSAESSGGSVDLYDAVNEQNILIANEGGNVEIPNGVLDMNSNEAQNFVIENRTSDPSSPSTGQLWIRTDL